MPNTPRIQRRTLFSLAGASLLSRPGGARLVPSGGTGGQASATVLATPMHDQRPALNVAGPRDSDLGAWARLMASPLAAGLMQGGQLDVRYGGGIDGVTGVNQFDARAAPDGREALLFPGSVLVGWLLGDRPVRFDCAHVLPLMAALGPGVLMVRDGLPGPAATTTPLRLARGGDLGGSLVALLGLELLSMPVTRVAHEKDANAIFLHGPQAAARAPDLMAANYTPALVTRTGQGDFGRAPFFLAGLSAARLRHDPLVAAWRAMAGAADLCAALVLPRLSPAEAIGRWRHASQGVLSDPGVAEQARHHALQLVTDGQAADALAPMRLGSPAQIALHRWLSDRAGAQPG